MIRNAYFTSVWDDGYEITSNCKVNLETKEVFDIELIDDENLEDCDILEHEYITIDGEDFDVFNKDEYEIEKGDYWYE